MADGQEEREEEKMRREWEERERQQEGSDRVIRERDDEWEPERGGS